MCQTLVLTGGQNTSVNKKYKASCTTSFPQQDVCACVCFKEGMRVREAEDRL